METIYFLLGNRDVQIKKDYLKYELSNKALAIIDKYFTSNSDGVDLVIKKIKGADFTFLEASEISLLAYEHLKDIFVFPMIEATLKYVKAEEKSLIFCSSKQVIPHYQDSYNFALIAQRYYTEKGISCNTSIFECDPNNFECLVNFFTTEFLKYSVSTSKFYVSNSGGTPNMRSASHFAGVFKGFEYISINSDTQEASSHTFKKQEDLILKQIIEKMLDVYDYAGILDLPIKNNKIISLSKYALSRIHLNQKEALNSISDLPDDNFYQILKKQISKSFSIRELEQELFYSAKIKFKQKAYADYLWRLFTIHDNLLIPILEDFFNEKIIYNKPNHIEWNNLLDKFPEIKIDLSKIKFKEEPLNISYPNKFVYKEIYKIISKENYNVLLDVIDKILVSLSEIRNSIAHDYESIDLEKLNSNISIKNIRKGIKFIHKQLTEKEVENYILTNSPIDLFNQIFSSYLSIEENNFGIYDQINKKIISLL